MSAFLFGRIILHEKSNVGSVKSFVISIVNSINYHIEIDDDISRENIDVRNILKENIEERPNIAFLLTESNQEDTSDTLIDAAIFEAEDPKHYTIDRGIKIIRAKLSILADMFRKILLSEHVVELTVITTYGYDNMYPEIHITPEDFTEKYIELYLKDYDVPSQKFVMTNG